MSRALPLMLVGALAVLIAGAFVLSSQPAHAQSAFTVTNPGNEGPGTLRQAVADAAAGDTIVFDTDAMGTSTVLLTGIIRVERTLTIDGRGVVTIDAQGRSAHFSSGANFTLDGLTLIGGESNGNVGGSILATQRLTIRNSTFRDNSVPGSYQPDSHLYLGSGGAIYLSSGSHLTVINSSFIGNHAPEGGAIQHDGEGSVTITGSTFEGNTAIRRGGALRLRGPSRVTNSTFTENQIVDNEADEGNIFDGGAIATDGNLVVEYSTFVDNSSVNAARGTIYNGGFSTASLTMIGNIVQQEGSSSCVNQSGAAFSASGNLTTSTAGACSTNSPGFTYAAYTGLGPLQENGGPTKTHMPAVNSPAIDLGTGCPPPITDQRGVERAWNGACDAGSVELEQGTSPVRLDHVTSLRDGTLFSLAGNGTCDLREAIEAANTNATVSECLVPPNGVIAFDASLDGTITLSEGELVIDVGAPLTIDGDGRITIDAAGHSRHIHHTIPEAEAAPLTLDGLTFVNGLADDPGSGGSEGGSIRSLDELHIRNSTFANNSATTFGGAVMAFRSLSVVNSTFSGNSADTAGAIGMGGGETTADIGNSTFADNTATDYGGAILGSSEGNVHIVNSIVARGESAAGSCVGVFTGTGNLTDDESCTATGAFPAPVADVRLAPLADNGGVLSHAPFSDSPAIDAGDNTQCPAFDQRDAPRDDGACDIGSIELASDLSLTKDGPATAVPGTTIQYQIVVQQDSGSPLTVTVTDPLPEGTSLVTHDVSTGNDTACTPTSEPNAITCSFVDLPSGTPVTITLDVQVATGSAGAILQNTATASAVLNRNAAETVETEVQAVDLSIVKTAPATVRPGVELAYELAIGNAGNIDALNTFVTDTLPEGVTYDDAATDARNGAAASCDEPVTGTIACDVGTVAFGSSTTVWIIVDVDAEIPDGSLLTNAVAITSDGPEAADTLVDNEDSVETRVRYKTGVVLGKQVDRPSAAPGDTVTYTLEVGNSAGSDPASGIIVRDTLPEGVSLVSLGEGCTASDRTVTCDVGRLAGGESQRFDITVELAESLIDGMVLRNAAIAEASNGDRDQAHVDLEVTFPQDLAVQKVVSTRDARPGDVVRYDLTITNTALGGVAENVVLTDELPDNVTFTGVSAPTAWICDRSEAGLLVCEANEMAPGETVSIVLRVRLDDDASGDVENRAEVSSDDPDPDWSNNVAIARFPVTGDGSGGVPQPPIPVTPSPIATRTATPIATPTETPTATPTEGPGETFTYDLAFRWALITWYGADGVSVEDALSDIIGNVTALYGWRGTGWEGYFPAGIGIPGANDLESLLGGEAYWIAIDEVDGIRWTVVTVE